MTRIICLTSQVSVGCSFLDWTINYLSGRTKTYHAKLGWCPIPDNPLQGNNAHAYRKNHPLGLESARSCVANLKSDWSTVYAAPGFFTNTLTAGFNWLHIQNNVIQDYQQMLQWFDNQGAKILFVSLSESLPLYLVNKRGHDRLFLTGMPGNEEDRMQQLEQAFFQHDVEAWEKQRLVDVWDKRERMALNARPFNYRHWPIDFNFDHHWIDSQDLWFNGVETVHDVMNWLNLKILTDRYTSWIDVYRKWQTIQIQNLKFQWQYQHIIQSIINAWNFTIDLTFAQEIVIQHCLIYQHNLNLKTWQLHKFPNNTQKLHDLLEPNVHVVPKIY